MCYVLSGTLKYNLNTQFLFSRNARLIAIAYDFTPRMLCETRS